MKYIILDRDGVINYDSEHYIKTPDEWIPMPGSIEAIARLHQAGYKIAIATNQSGIARGLYNLDILNAIHEKLRSAVKLAGGNIDVIFFCPHHPEEQCGCRKPEPGMLLSAARHFDISLSGVHMVGDTWRDAQAAQQAGCTPLLVRSNMPGYFDDVSNKFPNVQKFENLSQAVDFVLADKQ